MAFSYSDKNFTVIGNLCFVHILLDGTEKFINIPPAIADRMLDSNIICTYPYLSSSDSTKGIGYAIIIKRKSKISLSNVDKGYAELLLHAL